MHRRPFVVILVTLVAAAVVGPVVSGGVGADGDQTSLVIQTGPEGFDETVFEIELTADGDARWTVQHSRPLGDNESVKEFKTFADRFRTEELDVYQRFQTRAQRLTDQGSEVTGREMEATDFRRDAYVNELGQRRGVITMSFRWSNFATVENETVVVGDLFAGGFAITDGQRLRLRAGEGLAFSPASVEPKPDSMSTPSNLTESETVTWFGEREFADARPRAELVPPERLEDTAGQESTDDGQSSADDTGVGDGETSSDGSVDDTVDESGDGGMGMVPFAVAGVVILLAVSGAVAWYGRQNEESTATESTPPASEPVDGAASPEPATPSPDELLTDEDRVIQLLEDNDGRMKQVNIVEQTEWSKSKVSMLLSDMEDDGEITKLRVGRENIISLAGEEPDAAGSPFDDE